VADVADVADEVDLVNRLRQGDELAFVGLVERYHPQLVRLAASFVPNRAVAEEVAQDTWLAVFKGIDRFEGRSSFKTWLFRILVNRARSTGVKERRETPSATGSEPGVPAERFGGDGTWVTPPAPWDDEAVDRLVAGELAGQVAGYLDDLPENQRRVVLLRDVEDLPSGEVCRLLGISDVNQRVLLHRGRSRIRARLEQAVGV
jgi:RNA polymerase sigma-70 factor (ECF subfamily)